MYKKVAIVTGASSGMGLLTALNLINKGFTVYGCARRIDNMDEITKKGGFVLPLDVTDEASMSSCVNAVAAKEGRIDVLINNAGYGSCGSIEDVPMEEVKHQYEVNVFGLGRMTQLVLPYMRKQHSGRIVNISSMGGRFTSPFGGWYHSTKYAVESISDALRMEVKPFGIDVVIIEPGMIKTNWGVIASENIIKSSKNSAYKESAEKAAKYFGDRYNSNSYSLTNPMKLADVITKSAIVKHPKTRYLVGKGAKSNTLMKKILPDKVFQKLCIKYMGL